MSKCQTIAICLTIRLPIKIPVACAAFPHELAYQPKVALRGKYPNMVQFNHLPRGGHFAAFEEPDLLAKDIFAFVDLVEFTKTMTEEKKAKESEMPKIKEKIKQPTKI